MPDVLLACTLFREGGAQLAGPAMIKTQPMHTVQRVTSTFCRWAGLPAEQCQLHFNSAALNPEATIAAAGLASGSAITVMLAAAGPDPATNACAAPFAMLDVRSAIPLQPNNHPLELSKASLREWLCSRDSHRLLTGRGQRARGGNGRRLGRLRWLGRHLRSFEQTLQ